MSSISIIGTGNMARTIGALAVAGGNTVEVMGRDQSKAANLTKALGGGATTGEWGAPTPSCAAQANAPTPSSKPGISCANSDAARGRPGNSPKPSADSEAISST